MRAPAACRLLPDARPGHASVSARHAPWACVGFCPSCDLGVRRFLPAVCPALPVAVRAVLRCVATACSYCLMFGGGAPPCLAYSCFLIRGTAGGAAGAAGAGGAGGAGGAAGAGVTTGGAGAGGTTGAGGAGAGGTGGPGGAGAAGPGGARNRGAGATGAGGAVGAGGATGGARARGIGGTGGAGAAGPGGACTRGAGAARAGGAAGAGGAGAVGTRGTGAGGAAGAGGAGGAADDTGTAPRRPFFYPQQQSSLPPPDSALCNVLSLSSSIGLTPPLLCPPSGPSQSQLPPGSQLPATSPYIELLDSRTERREPVSHASKPVCGCHVTRPRPPAVPGTQTMALRPSSVPQHVALLSPLASSLPNVPDLESDLARAASPTVTRLCATAVTDPVFESTAAFALFAELLDFAARSRLNYTASLVNYLWRPVYKLREAPRKWHDTLRTTLAALGFAPSFADPSLCLRTGTFLLPYYVLVQSCRRDTPDLGPSALRLPVLLATAQSLPTGHSLSAPPLDESVEPSGPYPELVGCLMYLMTCTRPDLAYPPSLLACYVAPRRHRKVSLVLTGHSDTSSADDQASQRSSQGYTFSLGSVSISWRSTRSSSVLGSSCEAEIHTGAVAAQEIRWLTYVLTDLGERPRSPPVLYVDNKAMLALCHEHRQEHRTKDIALRYFLARELQLCGQICLSYVASWANTADVFTNALGSSDHQRFCTALRHLPSMPHQTLHVYSC
ncbi:unnamed protein product [Closterium sp. NIES-53]